MDNGLTRPAASAEGDADGGKFRTTVYLTEAELTSLDELKVYFRRQEKRKVDQSHLIARPSATTARRCCPAEARPREGNAMGAENFNRQFILLDFADLDNPDFLAFTRSPEFSAYLLMRRHVWRSLEPHYNGPARLLQPGLPGLLARA